MTTADIIKDMMHVQFLNTAAFLLFQRVMLHSVWPEAGGDAQVSKLEEEHRFAELCALSNQWSGDSNPGFGTWDYIEVFSCYMALYPLICESINCSFTASFCVSLYKSGGRKPGGPAPGPESFQMLSNPPPACSSDYRQQANRVVCHR